MFDLFFMLSDTHTHTHSHSCQVRRTIIYNAASYGAQSYTMLPVTAHKHQQLLNAHVSMEPDRTYQSPGAVKEPKEALPQQSMTRATVATPQPTRTTINANDPTQWPALLYLYLHLYTFIYAYVYIYIYIYVCSDRCCKGRRCRRSPRN